MSENKKMDAMLIPVDLGKSFAADWAAGTADVPVQAQRKPSVENGSPVLSVGDGFNWSPCDDIA